MLAVPMAKDLGVTAPTVFAAFPAALVLSAAPTRAFSSTGWVAGWLVIDIGTQSSGFNMEL